MRRIVAIVALIAAAVLLWPNRPEAGGPCTAPKAWGRVAGIQPGPAGPIVAFEAEDGTVRFTPATLRQSREVDLHHRAQLTQGTSG